MAEIISGKVVSAAKREEIKNRVAALKENGKDVGLAVIIVGNNSASRVYVNNKKKACEFTGMRSVEYAMPEETTEEELLSMVDEGEQSGTIGEQESELIRNAMELNENDCADIKTEFTPEKIDKLLSLRKSAGFAKKIGCPILGTQNFIENLLGQRHLHSHSNRRLAYIDPTPQHGCIF